ncbi:MAG: hypothetical protein WC445_01080 [Patescibacteria group bacterium]
MTPSEIRENFQLYQSGKISLADYTHRITPAGRVIAPVPQTMQIPFFDAAKTQRAKLLNLLQDGLPHSTPEIMQKVYGNEHCGIARIGARINDLVKEGYVFVDENGIELKENRRGWADKNDRSVYWYCLKEFRQKWYAK